MSAPPNLDVEFVRSQFPMLGDWAMMENAGGTLVPHTVIDRVDDYMRHCQVQPGAGFEPSAEAQRRIDQSQQLMATMLNATPEEVMVGISTSMNVYLLSHAIAHWFKEGDALVVTNLDHEANNGAWRRLAERGVEIREWCINPQTAELETHDLDELLADGAVRLVCFTHCSNITGGVHDVKTLVARIHAAGALACVDAVAYAPHRALDVKDLDVDFYLCSLYKLYGPHLALLYGKREHLLAARGQNHFFIGEDRIPLKLNPGGPNHEFTAALSGITAYFDTLHAHHFPGSNADLRTRLRECFELVEAHEEHLATRFVDFLASKPSVRIIGRHSGERARRVPTFSFTVAGRDSRDFPTAALQHKVGIRAGDFYARRCIDALGLAAHHGVVRASFVHYNNDEELDRLIRSLDEATG